MGCLVYQEKISEYLDDLLPTTERQQVEDHLSACSHCYVLYKDLATIYEASQNLPEYEPREIVWERILTQISSSQVGASAPLGATWITRWSPFKTANFGAFMWQPFLVAAMVLVGLGGIITYMRSPEPQPAPVAEGERPWTNGELRTDVRPTNKLVIDKPLIEVDMVEQRIHELEEQIETLQSRWSPEVRAFYQRNLRMIDECLSRCQDEAITQTSDPAVQKVYQAALRAKLEMLRQFSHL